MKPKVSASRKKQLGAVMSTVSSLTVIHHKYMATPREYLPGEQLLMREVHFVMEIGLENQPTVSELAERLGVTSGAISQVATRMEKKGYVRRISDAEDKRKNILTLTEKGETLYEAHQVYDTVKLKGISDRLSDFSGEQLQSFVEIGQILASYLDKTGELRRKY